MLRTQTSSVLVLAGLLAATLPAGATDAPPAGRYRCYAPPSYTVVGWFDLEANGTYRPDTGAGGRYAMDARTGLLHWLGGAHAGTGHVGEYVAPGPASPGGNRHTIVLRPADARSGKATWNRYPQCYLTTH